MNPFEGKRPVMLTIGEFYLPNSYKEHKCPRPFSSEGYLAIVSDTKDFLTFMFISMRPPLTVPIAHCPWCGEKFRAIEE